MPSIMKIRFKYCITDSTKITPLLIATKKNHIEIVKELLASNPRLDIEGLLKLEAGAGIRRLNPFQCSLNCGHPELTRMLVQAGHDLTLEKYLWTNEDLPEYLVQDVDLWLWLQEIISQPLPLLEIIRRYLRKLLGFQICYKLKSITLPSALKLYLQT